MATNREWLNGLAKEAPHALAEWMDAEHVDGGSHESREGYEERLYGVPVSDCPYCGCSRVVIHEWNENYERPNSYRVEHVDEKEAFNCDCFTSYYAFDSVEKAVEHADMRSDGGVAAEHADACPIDGGRSIGEPGLDMNLVIELNARISEQDRRIVELTEEISKRDKGIYRLKRRRDELERALEIDGRIRASQDGAIEEVARQRDEALEKLEEYEGSAEASAVIDELRDAAQDGFLKAKLGVIAELEAKLRVLKAHGVEIVDAAAGGYEVYNEAAREREEMRAKLSKALGYAHDILALMD